MGHLLNPLLLIPKAAAAPATAISRVAAQIPLPAANAVLTNAAGRNAGRTLLRVYLNIASPAARWAGRPSARPAWYVLCILLVSELTAPVPAFIHCHPLTAAVLPTALLPLLKPAITAPVPRAEV